MFTNVVRAGSGLTLISVVATSALAQTVVSGTIRRERSEPLADASVQIQGTRIGAVSGTTGRYRLTIPPAMADTIDSVTVIVRRIGFAPTAKRVATRNGDISADFTLAVATLELESVVVTGTAAADGSAMPGRSKDRARPVRDVVAKAPARASAEERADGSRVRQVRGTVSQAPSPGVLTAAVWNDAEHWQQYSRFLGRASENAWNPWGLNVGQSTIRPIRAASHPRSPRRALDLGFLVDATGSMGDEMTFLESELQDIVRRVRAIEPDLDIRLSVVFYRDRGDAFITRQLPFTRSIEQAVSFISGTGAGGGGDFPEDMNAGLEAMMGQAWSVDAVPQMLFLLADAPPHQYPGEDYTYHEAIRDAAAKGIAIYPVAASGVDKPTEFLFRAMAVMTGGKYIFLTDDSGVGDSHEEPDIAGYTVEKLNDLMVREIRTYVATHSAVREVVGGR
jgi:Mg-chelatase subunit ChlD